jgi:hypothetical protein
MELCELAAKEPDPKRLMTLTEEIIRLLDEKRQPLNRRASTLSDGPSDFTKMRSSLQ